MKSSHVSASASLSEAPDAGGRDKKENVEEADDESAVGAAAAEKAEVYAEDVEAAVEKVEEAIVAISGGAPETEETPVDATGRERFDEAEK